MTEDIDIYTDLDPQALNDVGMAIYAKWVSFAMGKTSLGGSKIMHPTGKMASAISYRRLGVYKVAIVLDEKAAPEGAILESGHDRIDMLAHLVPGKTYPMHRGTGGAKPILSGKSQSRSRNIWAAVRAGGATGYARTPSDPSKRGASNTSGTGPAWTIPSMRAYSPAQHLADLIADHIKDGKDI